MTETDQNGSDAWPRGTPGATPHRHSTLQGDNARAEGLHVHEAEQAMWRVRGKKRRIKARWSGTFARGVSRGLVIQESLLWIEAHAGRRPAGRRISGLENDGARAQGDPSVAWCRARCCIALHPPSSAWFMNKVRVRVWFININSISRCNWWSWTLSPIPCKIWTTFASTRKEERRKKDQT